MNNNQMQHFVILDEKHLKEAYLVADMVTAGSVCGCHAASLTSITPTCLNPGTNWYKYWLCVILSGLELLI